MPTILVAVAGALGAVVRYRIGLALAVALAAVPGAIECFVGLAYSPDLSRDEMTRGT